MQRDHLGSRLGFILLSAGCAIGVGNVWKFPWMVGQYGGGAFVIIYLIFLILLGLPVMTMEISMGRAAQKSPILLYQQLTPTRKEWNIHGVFSLIGNVVLMMFYTMVCGWFLFYFINTAMGTFTNATNDEVAAVFTNLCSSPGTLIIYTIIVCVLGFGILSFSLKGGLERVTKWMMCALFILMTAVAIKGIFMSGAGDGLRFYMVPDFSKINLDVVVAAMNQAFFTLSLGIGAMAIFGSYINKERAVLGESIRIVALDTFVAFVAGLIIFPACFTYNLEPGAGPSLIFITLPNVFVNMPGGRFWGSLFFLFMTFAAFSTVLAVFENILACVRDLTDFSRSRIAYICCFAIIILSIPCCLGFNLLSNVMPLGTGTGIMDLEDFVVSNCLLPLGALVYVIYCTSKFGWGFDNFLKEANQGKGAKFPRWAYTYCKYILPLIILIIFIIGVRSYITLKDIFMIVLFYVIASVVVDRRNSKDGLLDGNQEAFKKTTKKMFKPVKKEYA